MISDTEFLDRIVENEDFDPTADELDRLIALARLGAKWKDSQKQQDSKE